MSLRDDIEEAFTAGRLYLIIDEKSVSDPYGVRHRFVHVMSKAAGGEVHGYEILDGGALRVRRPAYAWGGCEEMDSAVLSRVPGATEVRP